MLQRNLSNSTSSPSWWQDLEHGAPTIAGFASLCTQAIGNGLLAEAVTDQDTAKSDSDQSPSSLPTNVGSLARMNVESQVLLALAANRGTFEIRAKQDGFDAVERFLAVAVEVQPDSWRLLLEKSNPRQTIRFLEAFAQLCQQGLMIHHLQREFSLSSRGFDLAEKICSNDKCLPKELLEFGEEV